MLPAFADSLGRPEVNAGLQAAKRFRSLCFAFLGGGSLVVVVTARQCLDTVAVIRVQHKMPAHRAPLRCARVDCTFDDGMPVFVSREAITTISSLSHARDWGRHLDRRSDRHGAPVLICPVRRPGRKRWCTMCTKATGTMTYDEVCDEGVLFCSRQQKATPMYTV